MTFLPIVERELRVRARLKSTYQFRLFAAVGAILLVGLLLMMSETLVAAGKYGAMLFNLLAWLAFAYCVLEGARNTSDCLSEEKRSGTLGLLFLTDLRPYDVVLGKLMATSLNSFYGLLAIFPPLAIPLVIGGVTVGEFWRLVLVLMNTLFFSLAVGMAVSAASRDGRRAWTATVGILVFFAAAPPWLILSPSWASSTLAASSPTTGFLHLFDAAYSITPDRYWHSLWTIQILAWMSLIAASFILPRSWQDRPSSSAFPWWRPRGAVPREVRANEGFSAQSLLLDANPIVWLVNRSGREQAWIWALVMAAGGIAIGAWILASGQQPIALTIFIVMLLVHLTIAVWVASEACHLFADARDSGALELLLCTPLSAREIVEGHMLGLRRRFYRPVLTLLALEIILLAAQIFVAGDSAAGSLLMVILVGLCFVSAVMDLVAVARYGLWQGLVNRKVSRAISKTVIYVLVLPLFGICAWPVVGLIKNLIFINYAKEQLRRQFRALLTGQYGWAEEQDFVGQPSARARSNPLPRVLPR